MGDLVVRPPTYPMRNIDRLVFNNPAPPFFRERMEWPLPIHNATAYRVGSTFEQVQQRWYILNVASTRLPRYPSWSVGWGPWGIQAVNKAT